MARFLLGSLVALGLASLSPGGLPPASAEATASALGGTWVFVPRDSDDLEAAINTAADKVNFVIRGLATGRLRDTNKPYRRIAITRGQGGTTTVETDTRGPVTAPAGGASVKWTRSDKQVYDVTMTWRSERRLEETFASAEGRRVNVYALRPGGQAMDMHVTVTSPRLPVPLTYRLAYRRVP
ncbi:MAG: hypothetical protein VKQ33_09190 [Candidatus Sericytochromatia bacterium]|nr:hypothetical protein [Candidatus Sericytochromatia bacterium]